MLRRRGLGGPGLLGVGKLAGGEQVGHDLGLQPVRALLVPHRADGGPGRLVRI
jgi:hypothetical protein